MAAHDDRLAQLAAADRAEARTAAPDLDDRDHALEHEEEHRFE